MSLEQKELLRSSTLSIKGQSVNMWLWSHMVSAPTTTLGAQQKTPTRETPKWLT